MLETGLGIETEHNLFAEFSYLRDILELLAKCDSEDLTVPTYVILSANEVPLVPDLMFSHLSSKLTRMEKVLNAVASRAEVYDNHFPPLPQLIEPNVLATIVVFKILASLDNPLKRKEMLDKVTGHECVISIKAKKEQLIVHIDESTVNDFCSSIKNTVTSCATKIVTQKILGIAEGILLDFDVDQFCSEPGIASASCHDLTLDLHLHRCDKILAYQILSYAAADPAKHVYHAYINITFNFNFHPKRQNIAHGVPILKLKGRSGIIILSPMSAIWSPFYEELYLLMPSFVNVTK
ncbi:hypothetical protein QYM36_004085 [Artemia franciscana]|uniref:Uncharacterized protein n=1 Tax=Artemia franciscana TaxID=6661 RepID=A0AA88LC60_ARTSF|nr:hypothetical protein QYM36_004085 [Artemia franciscana]